MELEAGEGGGRPVVDPGGVLLDEAVLAAKAPAGDQVVPGVEHPDQGRDLGGVVLEVGVHRHHLLPPDGGEAGGHRRRLAEVAAELDHPDPRLGGGERLQDLEGTVVGTVVDEDDLPGPPGPSERLLQPLGQRREILLLVEERDEDGQVDLFSVFWHFSFQQSSSDNADALLHRGSGVPAAILASSDRAEDGPPTDIVSACSAVEPGGAASRRDPGRLGSGRDVPPTNSQIVRP